MVKEIQRDYVSYNLPSAPSHVGDHPPQYSHALWCEIARCSINTLRPRQNGRRFADDTSKRIFLNENVWIPIKISLRCVPKGPINNIPALVQIMAWRRSGDKPLSEPMVDSLPTHICVTRPQWVNGFSKPTIDSTYYLYIVLGPSFPCGWTIAWRRKFFIYVYFPFTM